MFSFSNIILLRGIGTSGLIDNVTFNTKGTKGILNKFKSIVSAKNLGGSRMLSDDLVMKC